MTTRGIIERVMTPQDGSYHMYKVRLPIFHGIKSRPDAVPTDSLPTAQYATVPHGEKTRLNEGDVVFCELLDYDLDSVVILGLVPTSGTYQGSAQSLSSIIVNNIEDLEFKSKGIAKLPVNTSIQDDEGKTLVTKDNLACLAGLEYNVQEELDKISGSYKIEVIDADTFDDICNDTTLAKENTLYFVYSTGA